MILTDEEIISIRNKAVLNDDRQIYPMAFARDIEKAVLDAQRAMPKHQDVYEIVQHYLSSSNFDGLVNSSVNCGCRAGDLAPCGEIGGDCEPAYLHISSNGDMSIFSTEKNLTDEQIIRIVDGGDL